MAHGNTVYYSRGTLPRGSLPNSNSVTAVIGRVCIKQSDWYDDRYDRPSDKSQWCKHQLLVCRETPLFAVHTRSCYYSTCLLALPPEQSQLVSQAQTHKKFTTSTNARDTVRRSKASLIPRPRPKRFGVGPKDTHEQISFAGSVPRSMGTRLLMALQQRRSVSVHNS